MKKQTTELLNIIKGLKKILRNKLYFAYTYKEIKNSSQLIKKVEKDLEDIKLEIIESRVV